MAEFRLEESSADNRLNRRLHQKIHGKSCLPVIQMDMGREVQQRLPDIVSKKKIFAGQRQRQNL